MQSFEQFLASLPLLDPGDGAYATLSALWRGRLKEQIAFVDAWCSSLNRPEIIRVDCLCSGNLVSRCFAPRDWQLLLISAQWQSAPGLIAAALPALSAGCRIIPLMMRDTHESPPAPLTDALSAALELLGLEEVYALPLEQQSNFMEQVTHMHTRTGSGAGTGSIICLGAPPDVVAMGLLSALDVPVIRLPARVRFNAACGAGLDRSFLQWAYGEQVFEPSIGAERDSVHVQLCGVEHGHGSLLRTRELEFELSPETAHLWVWPQITPSLFLRECVIITTKDGIQ